MLRQSWMAAQFWSHESKSAHTAVKSRPYRQGGKAIGPILRPRMQPRAGGVAKNHLAMAGPVQTGHSSSHSIICGGGPISRLDGAAIRFGAMRLM